MADRKAQVPDRAGEKMPRFDMDKEFVNLSESDRHFVQKLQKTNLKRANDWLSIRKRNRYLGVSIGFGALAIYAYTIYKFRQEQFLDFDEIPEPKKQ